MNQRQARKRALSHAAGFIETAMDSWDMAKTYPDDRDRKMVTEEICKIILRLEDQSAAIAPPKSS